MELLLLLIATAIDIFTPFVLPANHSLLQLPSPFSPHCSAGHPSRTMWPAIGEEVGIEPDHITDGITHQRIRPLATCDKSNRSFDP